MFVIIIAHVRRRRMENSSEIHAHGIYRSVKLFSPANQIARNKHNDEELELNTFNMTVSGDMVCCIVPRVCFPIPSSGAMSEHGPIIWLTFTRN